MNETIRPPAALASDVPWPTSADRVRVPDTSMLPGSETAPPPAVKLLNDTVRGAHDTLDRLAEGAAPAVQQFGERVSAAGDVLQAKTGQLREAKDEWVELVRTTVRGNPLACVVAAAALGAVIARVTR